MAISGTFKDISFAEALRIVGKRTGKLLILNINDNLRYEWFVHQKTITAVRAHGASLVDVEEIYQLAALHGADTTNSFIFYPLKLEKLPIEVSMPIADAILRVLSAAPNQNEYRDQLPNPNTRFSINREQQIALPSDLQQFWNLCLAQPLAEFSARDIAVEMNASVEKVQFAFSQLRTLGAIQPVRLLAHTATRQSNVKLESNVDSPAPVAETNRIAEPAMSSVKTAVHERQSLVKRMLSAISTRKKIW